MIMDADDENIIRRLTTMAGEELIYTFDIHYVQLLKNIDGKNHAMEIQIVEIFQKYCESSNFENCVVFQTVIQELCELYAKNVSLVDVILRSNASEDDLKKVLCILQINTSIIKSFSEFQLNIISFQISSHVLRDVAVDIVSVLLKSFKHIRNYADVYKEVNQSVIEKMNLLFRQCQETLEHCFNFLDALSKFNDTKEAGNLLIIVNRIFDIGVAVSDMDLKTMAQAWKGFLAVLKSFATQVKDKIDLVRIMTVINEEFIRRVNSVFEERDAKCQEMAVKIIAFFLKIMLRICEYLNGNLETSFPIILKHIYYVYKISEIQNKTPAIFSHLTEELVRTLLPMLDELIGILILDEKFAHYFLETQDKYSDFGILLALHTILQKLVSCEEEVQSIWLKLPLWDSCLRIISKNYTILYGSVKLPTTCVCSSVSPNIFLYDAMMVNMASLIVCTVIVDQFLFLEEVLIKYLLYSPIIVQLFVMDLWYIIDRYGSSELCHQHISYLLSLLHQVNFEKTEAVILKCLIKRLFTSLAPTQQIKILEESNILNTDFILFSEVLQNSKSVTVSALQQLQNLKKISNRSSSEDTTILRIVLAFRDSNSLLDEDLTLWIQKFIVERWKISHMVTLSERNSYHQVSEFLYYLCATTAILIGSLQCDHAAEVLYNVNKMTFSESVLVSLNVLGVLRAFGKSTMNGPRKSEICASLSSSFRCYLLSGNPIVRQSTLESFSYFSLKTEHEEVIQNIIANNSSLKDDICSYLRKQTRQNNVNRFENLVAQLLNYESKEIINKVFTNKDLSPQSKKFKSGLEAKIVETETEMRSFLKLLKTRSLSESEKNKLRTLVDVARELETIL